MTERAESRDALIREIEQVVNGMLRPHLSVEFQRDGKVYVASVSRLLRAALSALSSGAVAAPPAGEVETLRSALQAIHTTVRGDEKSECWTIRKWLDERGVFNDDISGQRRLVEAVCVFALAGWAPPASAPQDAQPPQTDTPGADDPDPACTSCDGTGIRLFNDEYCHCSRGAEARREEESSVPSAEGTCKVCGGSGFVAQKQFIEDGYGEVDSCPACEPPKAVDLMDALRRALPKEPGR